MNGMKKRHITSLARVCGIAAGVGAVCAEQRHNDRDEGVKFIAGPWQDICHRR